MAALPNHNQSVGSDGESDGHYSIYIHFDAKSCKDFLIGTLVYRASISLSLTGSGKSRSGIEVSPLFPSFIHRRLLD